MPNTGTHIGRIDLSVRAYHWFGRPLLLAMIAAKDFSAERVDDAITSKLSLGCDGFAIGLRAADALSVEQVDLFEYVVQTYCRTAFVYVELKSAGIERQVLDVLRQHHFPSGHTVASSKQSTLIELYRICPKNDSRLTLLVDTEKTASDNINCPYTSVEFVDKLVTHDRITKVHRSMKGVFVRIPSGKVTNELNAKRIEERLRWLAHERVDAVISGDVRLLEVATRCLGHVNPQ